MSAERVNLFSGRVARALHDAFELGPVSRTVRRFFFDSTEVKDEVKVKALGETGQLLAEEGLLEWPFEPLLAGSVFARTGLEWDALSAFLQSAPSGYYLLMAISRLWCADLALRSAALRCARGLPPRDEPPAWSSPRAFAFALRKELEQRGMTRRAFWEAMDINKPQADEWLDGVQIPSRSSIRSMAAVLSCDAVALWRVAGCSRIAQQLAPRLDLEVLGTTFRQYEAAFWRELVRADLLEWVEVIGDGFNARRGRLFGALALATEERPEWRAALVAVTEDWSTFIGEEGVVRSALESEALSLFREERREEGLRLLRDAVERKPLDAGLRTLLASWLNHFGRRELALREAELAACTEPTCVDAMVELSVIQRDLGRTAEALRRLDASRAKLAEPSARVLHQLAQLRLELKDFTGAKAALAELVLMQPTNVLALDQLASVEVHLGLPKLAEKHARDAWRQGSSYTWMRLHPELEWEAWQPLIDDE